MKVSRQLLVILNMKKRLKGEQEKTGLDMRKNFKLLDLETIPSHGHKMVLPDTFKAEKNSFKLLQNPPRRLSSMVP